MLPCLLLQVSFISEYKMEGVLQTEKRFSLFLASAVSAPLSFDSFVFQNSYDSCTGLVARQVEL